MPGNALRNALWILACATLASAQEPRPGADRLAVAQRVADWLTSKAKRSDKGTDWVIDEDAERPQRSPYLYSGTAGIVLFYLELHHAKGRAADLDLARAAAERIHHGVAERLRREPMGLYTGVAGLLFMYTELYRSTGDAKDRQRAMDCLDALRFVAAKRTKKGRKGVDWNTVTDVISGTAGIGLALLRAAEDFGREDARKLAVRAGERLLELAQPVGDGGRDDAARLLRWQMTPAYGREMPNFSHGTAGIAYFLLRLHEATEDGRFLRAARAGADYLITITGSDGFIYHNHKARDLDYLGWCHGPPGTARLFHALHRATGDEKYDAWLKTAADKLAASPIPRKKTPGFWNNHGQCCGTAGVADFFLTLRATTGTKSFDARIAGLLDALAEAAYEDVDTGGLSWTDAEHRVRPDFLSTQTGYMQGAAGIGLLFLHDAARLRGAPRRIVLPDSPHPRK